jgi:Predicted metal binding domain
VEALVDPQVSREKFGRELADYRGLEADYRRKGWFMVKADFPNITVIFASPKTKPSCVIFAADINFENYDLWPPSVRLVDPFTGTPYSLEQLPTNLPRLVPVPVPPGQIAPLTPQPLMVAHGNDQIPFLCLPGIREYHTHPAHTGDSWLLHRGKGEGTLNFILTQLHKYGVEPITSLQHNLNVVFAGFGLNGIPQ